MKEQFIPYELAIELRNLGFDDHVFAFYWTDTKELILDSPDYLGKHNGVHLQAPLWQQAFDWFTSLGYHSYIEGAYPWFRYYINSEDNRWEGYKHLKIEEARLECLEKLIEIIKNNNINEQNKNQCRNSG